MLAHNAERNNLNRTFFFSIFIKFSRVCSFNIGCTVHLICLGRGYIRQLYDSLAAGTIVTRRCFLQDPGDSVFPKRE